MKAYGSGCIDPHFLDLGLVGGESSVSGPGRFTPRGKAGSINFIGDWVRHRARQNDVENRKFLYPLGLELQPIASDYSD
jgi:hypothetical protein